MKPEAILIVGLSVSVLIYIVGWTPYLIKLLKFNKHLKSQIKLNDKKRISSRGE